MNTSTLFDLADRVAIVTGGYDATIDRSFRRRGADRPGPELQHPVVHQMGPEKLLLPGPAEELPDITICPASGCQWLFRN